jgi:lipoprotein-anchoring transpeptidase ErfK/SrfK
MIAAVGTFMLAACTIVALGAVMLYGGSGVLQGVSVAGIDVSGQSRAEAARTLQESWAGGGIVLRDGNRTMPVEPAMLGITLDADASADAAVQYGRAYGGLTAAIEALVSGAALEPVLRLDENAAANGLQSLAEQVSLPAVNAGVRLVNGQVQERPASQGRALDVGMTLARLHADPARELADGDLDLVMHPVAPTVTDAGPMVAAASALLAHPLEIVAWDPIEDEEQRWSVPPQQWSEWLTAETDASSSTGLRLGLDTPSLRAYLNGEQNNLESGEHLEIDDAISAVQDAIAANSTESVVRVYHSDAEHTVQPGETIISIAWDYGVPYPWIQQANPDAGDTLSEGQTITIPSADHFMDYAPVYGKRIVVSISQQRAWVYENGGLKWDWGVSTGIASSPTWPGIYQIISHEPNAYAANWDLYMPNFMGVYRPIPGTDFTNGFHGFPTRGGWQLLWTNDIGTRVTYGCILLDDTNSQLLYDWAEEGVVVEIQP